MRLRTFALSLAASFFASSSFAISTINPKEIKPGTVDTNEFGALDGVRTNIQWQIDNLPGGTNFSADQIQYTNYPPYGNVEEALDGLFVSNAYQQGQIDYLSTWVTNNSNGLTYVLSRTSVWDQAAADSSFATNWIATNAANPALWSYYPALTNVTLWDHWLTHDGTSKGIRIDTNGNITLNEADVDTFAGVSRSCINAGFSSGNQYLYGHVKGCENRGYVGSGASQTHTTGISIDSGGAINRGHLSGSGSSQYTASGRGSINEGCVLGNSSQSIYIGYGARNVGFLDNASSQRVGQALPLKYGYGSMNGGYLDNSANQYMYGEGSVNWGYLDGVNQLTDAKGALNFGGQNTNIHDYAMVFGDGINSIETNAVHARKYYEDGVALTSKYVQVEVDPIFTNWYATSYTGVHAWADFPAINNVLPDGDSTRDLGSAGASFRDVYFDRTIKSQGKELFTYSPGTHSPWTFYPWIDCHTNNLSYIDDIWYVQNCYISALTADGSDNGSLKLGGGSFPIVTRGGSIFLYGNEAGGEGGSVWIQAGGSGVPDGRIRLRTGPDGTSYYFDGLPDGTWTLHGSVLSNAVLKAVSAGDHLLATASNTWDVGELSIPFRYGYFNTLYEDGIALSNRYGGTNAISQWATYPAVTNVELNGHWLTSDGDEEGVWIGTGGQLSLGFVGGTRTNLGSGAINAGYLTSGGEQVLESTSYGSENRGYVTSTGRQIIKANSLGSMNFGEVSGGSQYIDGQAAANFGLLQGDCLQTISGGISAGGSMNFGNLYHATQSLASARSSWNVGELTYGKQIMTGRGSLNFGRVVGPIAGVVRQQITSGDGALNFGGANTNTHDFSATIGDGLTSYENNALHVNVLHASRLGSVTHPIGTLYLAGGTLYIDNKAALTTDPEGNTLVSNTTVYAEGTTNNMTNAVVYVPLSPTNDYSPISWWYWKNSTNAIASTNWVLAQGYVTDSVTNGLASTNWVVAQGYVTSSITNGLASTNWVLAQNYASSSITNGLASTNWVLTQGYSTDTTNGLASTSWVSNLPVSTFTNDAGYVTASVTNGLASTNWVLAQGYSTDTTNGLASTSWVVNLPVSTFTNDAGYVTSSVTNGLASTNWVLAQGYSTDTTNGLASTNWVLSQGYGSTNGLASTSWVVNLPISTFTNDSGYVTASVTNGLASTNWVIAQGYSTDTTNGLASTSWVVNLPVSTFTNDAGYVTETITNGLASTNWVLAQGYGSTNGLASTNWVLAQGYVTASITNGLASTNWVLAQNYVTSSITNGFASTNWVVAQGYVTASVTNGLASTNWVIAQGYGSTNGLASTNWVVAQGYVTASITNGLASTNWVLAQNYVTATITNGLASTSWVVNLPISTFSNDSGYVTATITNGLASTSWVANLPVSTFTNDSGYVTATITNGLASTNWVLAQNYVTASITNDLASTNWVLAQNYVTASITNGLASTNWVLNLPVSTFTNDSGYVTATITNGLASTSWVSNLPVSTFTNDSQYISSLNIATSNVRNYAWDDIDSLGSANGPYTYGWKLVKNSDDRVTALFTIPSDIDTNAPAYLGFAAYPAETTLSAGQTTAVWRVRIWNLTDQENTAGTSDQTTITTNSFAAPTQYYLNKFFFQINASVLAGADSHNCLQVELTHLGTDGGDTIEKFLGLQKTFGVVYKKRY